jgi:hypothetical protein
MLQQWGGKGSRWLVAVISRKLQLEDASGDEMFQHSDSAADKGVKVELL